MRTTVAPAKAPGTLTSDAALARRCPDGGCTSIAAGGLRGVQTPVAARGKTAPAPGRSGKRQ